MMMFHAPKERERSYKFLSFHLSRRGGRQGKVRTREGGVYASPRHPSPLRALARDSSRDARFTPSERDPRSRPLPQITPPVDQPHATTNMRQRPGKCSIWRWIGVSAEPRLRPTPNVQCRDLRFLLSFSELQYVSSPIRTLESSQTTRTCPVAFQNTLRSSKARHCLNHSREPTRIANREPCRWTLPSTFVQRQLDRRAQQHVHEDRLDRVQHVRRRRVLHLVRDQPRRDTRSTKNDHAFPKTTLSLSLSLSRQDSTKRLSRRARTR